MDRINEIKEESRSYLSFKIGEEIYAAHVAFVNNIIEVPRITKIPQAPDYIKGVLNLRGKVLPVIDTRIKLRLEATNITALTCILVLELNINGAVISVGALVDNVQEVIEINEADIIAPPKLSGLEETSQIISGMVNDKDKLIMLMDINKLFNNDEIIDISEHVSSIKAEVTE